MINEYLKLLLEAERLDDNDEENTKEEETEKYPDTSSDEDYDIGDSDDAMSGMKNKDPEYHPQTPEDLGKVYELKKIYYRLSAIQDYLSDFSDDKLYKVRSYISEALELFLLVSKNINIFKDELDEIIIIFYKFLKIVYMVIHKYIKEIDNGKEEAKMLNTIKLIKNTNN